MFYGVNDIEMAFCSFVCISILFVYLFMLLISSSSTLILPFWGVYVYFVVLILISFVIYWVHFIWLGIFWTYLTTKVNLGIS